MKGIEKKKINILFDARNRYIYIYIYYIYYIYIYIIYYIIYYVYYIIYYAYFIIYNIYICAAELRKSETAATVRRLILYR